MFSAKEYLLAQSLEQAYAANQKKTAKIVGGMCWLKMSNRPLQTIIDLSALDLNHIEESEDGFWIGSMVSLRELETHPLLNQAFTNVFADALKPIVGVQFRNCATVGGSVWGRFGFSDVSTLLLALDAQVELYPSGMISLEKFLQMPYDNQILVRILIPKQRKFAVVKSHRNTATDFPILVVAASTNPEGKLCIVAGARPQKACIVCSDLDIRSDLEVLTTQIEDCLKPISFGSNMRGSKAYREHLAKVLSLRAISDLKEELENGN